MSLENRLAKNTELKAAYSYTIRTDKDSGYIRTLEPTELLETRNETQWSLPDAKCLRFVWRENQSDDLSTYEYTRHLFGAKDLPTCANYALQRTATDNEEEFPVASRIVKRNFYMDDFLYSVENFQEAEFLKQNLISLLQKGGFKLSK